ncbi:uncharacterized protein LOC110447968 [Mizuhopecten yessoensis]|uniref:uncharacterized protein LOC110447968 n=1 Tax=Mizuhopecten yessoensis TaxID=6573 RepID=UPI000B45D276|nr:uncharacterized protein LOC110447968 [Mizuhopecten yessoensis]
MFTLSTRMHKKACNQLCTRTKLTWPNIDLNTQGFIMPPNNLDRDIQEHYETLKDVFSFFKSGRLRQGWNKFKENYLRKRYGANWEQHQVSKNEVGFLVIGIVIGLFILLSVFLFVILIDAIDHAFSKDWPFHEISAVTSFIKKNVTGGDVISSTLRKNIPSAYINLYMSYVCHIPV